MKKSKYFVIKHREKFNASGLYGWGNGYAIIYPDNPLFNMPRGDWSSDEMQLESLDWNQEITYCEIITDKDLSWLPASKSDIGALCIGFDTCHLHNSLIRRSHVGCSCSRS